jgi:hypothetical protein
MSDLVSMAKTFGQESKTLSGAQNAAGVSVPDGGDGTINSALSNAVQAAGLATGQLAAVADSHSRKLSNAYEQYQDAEQLCQELTAARAQAALSLNAIAESMLPAQADWGDPVNGLDAVRGLWAVPTTYRRAVAGELATATKNASSVERSALRALIADRKVNGNNARLSRQMREDLQETRAERSAAQGKMDNAPSGGEDTMLADGDADGLGLAGVVADTVRAIPYLGASAGAGITIWQNREQGESWGQSVADGLVSNGAALSAGIGVAAAIGTGSVAAVAAGVLVGGAFAVGVGDFVHNAFQENWGTDIQAYGVAGGIVHGLGDTASETGANLARLADDVGHGIASVASELNPFRSL